MSQAMPDTPQIPDRITSVMGFDFGTRRIGIAIGGQRATIVRAHSTRDCGGGKTRVNLLCRIRGRSVGFSGEPKRAYWLNLGTVDRVVAQTGQQHSGRSNSQRCRPVPHVVQWNAGQGSANAAARQMVSPLVDANRGPARHRTT